MFLHLGVFFFPSVLEDHAPFFFPWETLAPQEGTLISIIIMKYMLCKSNCKTRLLFQGSSHDRREEVKLIVRHVGVMQRRCLYLLLSHDTQHRFLLAGVRALLWRGIYFTLVSASDMLALSLARKFRG